MIMNTPQLQLDAAAAAAEQDNNDNDDVTAMRSSWNFRFRLMSVRSFAYDSEA